MTHWGYEVEPTQWTVSLVNLDTKEYLDSFVFTDQYEAENYGEWMVAQKHVEEAQNG